VTGSAALLTDTT